MYKIGELEDTKAITAKMHEYRKSLIEKEEYGKAIEVYNRNKYQKLILDESQKYSERQKAIVSQLEDNSLTGIFNF